MTRLLSALVASFALAVQLASAQTAASVRVRIDRAAEFYRSRDGFMGVVAVERDHQLIFQQGYGYANLEWQIPFTPDTRFRIGSLSKQFTAAAVLLLQQEGKLKTSDLLSRFYPHSPVAWGGITLRNLLTHSSGIPDVDFGLILKYSPHSPEELMQGVLEKPLAFQPGSKFEYANINYMLLGRVIEQASGEPYCRFLEERIFQPLQLAQTGCDWNSSLVSHRAYGYHPSGHGPFPVADLDLASLAGAGNLYSTAGDLVRWTEALHGGKVLAPASFAEMTKPFLHGYGYGLYIDGEGETLDIFHNGTVDGFFSFLDYLPGTKTTVVVLSNLVAEGNQSTPGSAALDTEIVHLAMNEDAILPSEGKEASVPENTLRSYVGRYGSADTKDPQFLLLTFADGHLYIQNEGSQKTPSRMVAESPLRFYLTNQEVEITFASGKTSSFDLVDLSGIWGDTFTRVQAPEAKAVDHAPK
ncbi:serine hydrolase domain-containing protein [Granulicella arctica]|uniref:CubicO group peptidase (Beta-lactamase class C family) n=1 Tax=Granulicella arctica TaxID=940613 RepID=A0A7Y9TUU5_9BACT|nr:serine hydrolase domain-containing protein [Granulicella arctica]NYF81148.1 CubicO group peptidase (beta-lactamase class C family) [Granulicella arctica]